MNKNNVEITRSSKVSVPLGLVLTGILVVVGYFLASTGRTVEATSKQVSELLRRMDLTLYVLTETKKKIDEHVFADKILTDQDVIKAMP